MRRIRSKILAITVGGLLFISVVSTLATNTVTRSWLEERTIARVQAELEHLADYVVEPCLIDDRVAIEEIVQRTVRGRRDIRYAFVVSARGEVMASSFLRGVPRDILRANPLPQDRESRVRLLRTEEGRILDVVRGILHGRAGEIHLGVDETVISDVTEKAVRMLLIAQAGTLALTILASFILADIIVRPVSRLAEGTRQVAQGDLSGKVRITTKDEIGELGSTFNVMVEELRRSQDELRELAAQAEGIVSSFPNALFVIEPSGRIRSVNPAACALTGLTRGEMEGRDLSELFVLGPGRSPINDLDTSLRRDGVTLSYDMAIRQEGGRAIPVAFQSAPMVDAESMFRGHVVEVRDLGRLYLAIEGLQKQRALLEEHRAERFETAISRIAEEDRAETHLVRSDRLVSLGQLAASVAHEINNPIFGITTFAKVIERDLQETGPADLDRDRLLKAARMIVSESTRCSNILRGFLGYARPRPPGTDDISLNSVLEEVGELITGKAKGQGVEVSRRMRTPDTVRADPDQMHQVFLNIELNGLQAMPDGGKLTVSTEPDVEAGSITVVVEDTGCGIPADQMEKIYDPFFTTKEKGVGTGLGLAVARALITRHNGTIAMSSTPGKGTVVRVTLPLSAGGSD